MKQSLLALVLSIVATLVSGAAWLQSKQPVSRAPVKAEEPEPPGYPLEDSMARLLRLTWKLGRALDQGNLNLAVFYHHEMDAITEEIVVHGVLHEEKPIGYMTSLMLQPPLAQLEGNLERGDLIKSRSSFMKVIESCNTCHTGVGVVHPPITPPPPLEPN